ncbi:MAG: hypothetical protein AAGA31_14630 [Bacteroidota bacterium]
MRTAITLLITVFLFTSASAQEVIRVEEQSLSLAFLLNFALPIEVDYDVRNYKIVYTTTDAFGQPDTASGLLCVPDDRELVFPLAVYNHGTVADRNGVLSVEGVAERLLAQGIAGSGYITVAPDYLGLGESDGFHPYVHAATEASAGRDMLLAVRDWLATQDIRQNGQLFLTGYSQGGHATAALHRDLSLHPKEDGLTVTAASHLSGPYSISKVMLGTLFEEGLPTLPGYIVYTYVSYNEVYDIYDELEQIFVEPYLGVIDSLANDLSSLGNFNARLDTLLRQNDAGLDALFQDSIRQILATRDTSKAIIQALIDNDTYDWAPPEPTLIYYCTEDEQVPFRNAILADSVMRANGSTTITLESGGARDHGECIFPAAIQTLEFFEQYANVYSVSTKGPVNRPDIRLSPNPVSSGDQIKLSGLPAEEHSYLIYDQLGRNLQKGQTERDGSLELPASLRPGMVLLRLHLPNGEFIVRKILIE